MNLLETKIVVSILLGLLRFLFGILPVKVYAFIINWHKNDDELNKRHQDSANCLIVRFQSFSGGVLFATCFLHMIPDVRESVNVLFHGVSAHEFPFSELIICIGFFMVYFIEELTHWCIHHLKSDNKTEPVQNSGDDEIVTDSTISSCTIQTPSTTTSTKHPKLCVQEKQKHFRGLLVIVALSIHSIFEGLSIGLQKSPSNIWYMFTAIIIHAATILYCIGFEMVIEGVDITTIVINITILACGSPIGVIIGLLFTLQSDVNERTKSVAICLLEGLSAGTVLYITFFEVLNREKLRESHRISRNICIVAGFGLMIAIQVFEI